MSSRPLKLLLVDDSAIMRLLVKRNLAESDLQVETTEAQDGRDALTKMDCQPDLILLDWNMPNMDGLQFAREIRERGSPIPILMLTTEVHFNARRQALTAGVNAFLTKPFSLEEFVTELKKLTLDLA